MSFSASVPILQIKKQTDLPFPGPSSACGQRLPERHKENDDPSKRTQYFAIAFYDLISSSTQSI
jgi:hypothetical protein